VIIRSLLLLLPLSLWAIILTSSALNVREKTSSLLGFLWVFFAVLLVNIAAVQAAWWQHSLNDNLFYGVPIDWVFSQAIICGAIIPLLRMYCLHILLRFTVQIVIMIVIHCYYIERITIDFFIVAIALTFIFPSVFLADATARGVYVYPRSFFQAVIWSVVIFWFFPSIIFSWSAESWQPLLDRSVIEAGIYFLPLCFPGYLIINALHHFAVDGNGTAFPYDPPEYLVTNGVYRYISNPMQLGICLAVAWWAVIIHSAWVGLSAFIALILFIVFKDVCNGSCTIGVNSKCWDDYHRKIGKWWPRQWRLKNNSRID